MELFDSDKSIYKLCIFLKHGHSIMILGDPAISAYNNYLKADDNAFIHKDDFS